MNEEQVRGAPRFTAEPWHRTESGDSFDGSGNGNGNDARTYTACGIDYQDYQGYEEEPYV